MGGLFSWLHRKPREEPGWTPTPPSPTITDGRHYLEGQPYTLPKDYQEEQRLSFQHHALYACLHRHYFAPLRQEKVKHILDIGCGPGGWLRDMARMFPLAHLVGLDIDGEQLPYANASTPPSCRFVQGDVLQGLPFADHTFDLRTPCQHM